MALISFGACIFVFRVLPLPFSGGLENSLFAVGIDICGVVSVPSGYFIGTGSR